MRLYEYPDILIILGIFKRVVDEVSDHLLHHALASEDRRHRTGQALIVKPDILLFGLGQILPAHFLHRLIDPVERHVDLLFIILDL